MTSVNSHRTHHVIGVFRRSHSGNARAANRLVTPETLAKAGVRGRRSREEVSHRNRTKIIRHLREKKGGHIRENKGDHNPAEYNRRPKDNLIKQLRRFAAGAIIPQLLLIPILSSSKSAKTPHKSSQTPLHANRNPKPNAQEVRKQRLLRKFLGEEDLIKRSKQVRPEEDQKQTDLREEVDELEPRAALVDGRQARDQKHREHEEKDDGEQEDWEVWVRDGEGVG